MPSQTIRARYANGVFTPLEPVGFEDGCEVEVGLPATPVSHAASGAGPRADAEEALLAGWLKEVNWHRGTAQLHDAAGGYVNLRFDPLLADEMLRLATQYVEVRGSGRFDDQDEWITVHVEQLQETATRSETFDLDVFLNNPEPKRFNPEAVVPIDLTDEEWEAFNRAIREGRKA